jgi:hypothetical protein
MDNTDVIHKPLTGGAGLLEGKFAFVPVRP